jgi:hypothetical protein
LAANFGIEASWACSTAFGDELSGFGRHLLAVADRQGRIEAEDILELVDAVDVDAMEMLVTRSRMNSSTTRHPMLLRELVRAGKSLLELVRGFYPDRLAAEALGNGYMIDAVARGGLSA